MILSEKFYPLAEKFRKLYATTDKYSLADMTKLLSEVELHNFLAGNSFEETFKDGWIKQSLNGPTIEEWNKYIAGKTVTFSCDVEWNGYKSGSDGNRFLFEVEFTTTDGQKHWNGLYYTPTTEKGKQHLSSTVKVSNLPAQTIDSIIFWDELNPGSHLKVTNIAMTINPLETVTPDLVSSLQWLQNTTILTEPTPGNYRAEAQAENLGAVGFFAAYSSPLQIGKKYKLSGMVRGNIPLIRYGDEATVPEVLTTTDKWQTFSLEFTAVSDIAIYGSASKAGDWFEVSDLHLSEVGG